MYVMDKIFVSCKVNREITRFRLDYILIKRQKSKNKKKQKQNKIKQNKQQQQKRAHV